MYNLPKRGGLRMVPNFNEAYKYFEIELSSIELHISNIINSDEHNNIKLLNLYEFNKYASERINFWQNHFRQLFKDMISVIDDRLMSSKDKADAIKIIFDDLLSDSYITLFERHIKNKIFSEYRLQTTTTNIENYIKNKIEAGKYKEIDIEKFLTSRIKSKKGNSLKNTFYVKKHIETHKKSLLKKS